MLFNQPLEVGYMLAQGIGILLRLVTESARTETLNYRLDEWMPDMEYSVRLG